MEIIYILIAISLVLVAVIVWTLFWAVGSGQYDDLEREGHRILMDDDNVSDAANVDPPEDSVSAPDDGDRHEPPTESGSPPRH